MKAMELYLIWASKLDDQIARHKEVAGDELVSAVANRRLPPCHPHRTPRIPPQPPKQLQEMRIMQVAKLKPWLNLLDFGDPA